MLLQTLFSPLDKLLAESGREPDDVQEAPSSPLDSLLAETESRELREPPPAARDAMPDMPRPPERLSGLEGLGPQTPEEQAELDRINADKLGAPTAEPVREPPPPTAGEQAATGRLIGPTPEGFESDRGAIEPVEEPGGFRRFFSSLGRRAAENFPITGEFARSRGIETPTRRRERLLDRARSGSLAFDSPEELGEIVGPQSKTEGAGEMIGSVVDPTILIPFVGGERLALKAWQEAARRGVPGAGRFIRAAAAEADAPLRSRLGAAAVRGAGTMGTGAAVAEVPHRLREEGRLPTPGEVGTAFGVGTVAGPVIGPAGELLATGGRAAVRALRGPAGEAGVAEAASALGVKPGATAEEIHAAYRAAARRHHPDVGDGDRAAFEAATAAYETLGAGRVDLAPQQGIFRRFADAARQAWDRATGGRAGTGARGGGAGAEPAPGQPGALVGPRAAEPAGARPAPRPEAPAPAVPPEPVRPAPEAEFVGPRELVGPQAPTGPVRVERGAVGIVADQLDPRKAFQTRMTPRQFLDIAAPRDPRVGSASREFLAGEVEAGRPLGAPFIEVRVRTASGLTGHDALQSGEPLEFEAVQHEGRNRAEVLAEQMGDEEIPVSLLFRDRVRASDFSPEQLEQLRSAEILPETRGRDPAAVEPEAVEAAPEPGQERPPRRAAHGGLPGPEVRIRAPSQLVPDVSYDVLATYRYPTEAIEHAENLAPGAVEVLQAGPEQFQIIRPKSPNARLVDLGEGPAAEDLADVPQEVIDEVDAEIAAEEGQRAIEELTGPETAPEKWPESTEERMRRDPSTIVDVPEAIEVGGRPAVSAGPDGAVYATVRAGDVMRDPERFQFKRVNREGVVEHLRGDFDPFLSGTIDVIRDPADGKLYVFEGHHRHLAALQAGDETPISVRIHDFGEEQARKMGALKNIAEGNATPTDAARFIREEGITPETLGDANIDLRKDVARLGMQLSNLPDDVFTRVATGDLTERMGAAIGDSGLSEAGMQALEKLVRNQPDLTIQQVRELARFVEGAGETTASQETLFGTEELTRSNALEKAKLSASVKRRLARDRNLFGYVARPGRAERLEQTGAGEIELEKAKELAQSAASLEELYTKLSTVTGPVSDALNAAAQELAGGGSEREILDRLYIDVVDAIKADPDVGRIGGAEPPDPNQQSLLGEGAPEYTPERAPRREPSPEMLEGPVEQWDPDPAKVRAAYERFGRSQHNVSFDEVLDYLPEAAAKKPWDTEVAGRNRQDRIRRGEPPMSKEQHAVAEAISHLSRGKGLELRTLDEQARALEGPEGVMDELKTGEGKVGAGLDPSLFKKLGANLYKENIVSVAFKEGIQNAVDATRGMSSSEIEIDVDEASRKVTIRDNGEGMSPDVAANEFMDVGGSAKREGASGGYGLAKVGLLSHTEHFKLTTVTRDGTLTTIEGSSEDWVSGNLDFATRRVSGARPSGTRLEITFDEEANLNWFAGFGFLENFMKYNQTGDVVRVRHQGDPWPQETASYDTERLTEFEDTRSVPVTGANITFKTSKETDKQRTEIAFLNNGLYQFKSGHWFQDEGRYPKHIVVDVQPTVNPDHPDYPFTTNREQAKDAVRKATDHYVAEIKNREAARRMDTLLEALRNPVRLAGNAGAVYATSGTVTRSTLERVAASSWAEPLTNVMRSVSDRVFDHIVNNTKYPGIDPFEFGGIGISKTYLGVNIRRSGVLRIIESESLDPVELSDENLILINPFAHITEIRDHSALDVTAREMAEQTFGTIVHEIAHQLASGHNESFAGVLTRLLGSVTSVQSRSVTELERVWEFALGEGIYDDLDVVEGEWHGENIFEAVSDEAARGDDLGGADADVRSGGAAGADRGGREVGSPDEGRVRGAPGERPEGARRRGAPVRGDRGEVDRAEALRDRLDELDRITQEEGRDETPEEVEEIMQILDELNDIAPSGPTYDAPISVPRQPGQSGEVSEAQGEYEALRRRFVAAFKHPDTGEIIKGSGEPHVVVARQSPDEMRLLDEWDRETDNVGFVDADGTFYTRAEAERLLPPEVPPESQAIANYGRRNVFGRGRGEVREGLGQEDMFGGTGPAEGGDQFGMGLEGPRPEGLSQAEQRAQATVERLRPLVEGKAATPEQVEEYREALALLNRDQPLRADEITLRSQEPLEPDDSGDLFGDLEGPSEVREGTQPDLFHDQVTWGGGLQANAARKKIVEENKALLQELAPEGRARRVAEGEEQLRENLNIDLVSRDIVIRRSQDVAPLAALFRSPTRELLQVFMFGDEVNGERKMLGHMIVTTGEIGSAGMSKEQVTDLLDMIDRTGARAVMLAHNHPSSDPTPSDDDRAFSAAVYSGLRGNDVEPLGHVVVNHGTAVLMSGRDPWVDEPLTYDPGDAVDWKSTVGRIKSQTDVAIMAGKTAGTDGFTILYSDSQNRPIALEMHPNSDVDLFKDRSWFPGRLEELAASQAFVVIDEGNPLHDSLRDKFLAVHRKTLMGVGPLPNLRDIVSVRGDKATWSAVQHGKLTGGRGGTLPTSTRVLEGAPPEYGGGNAGEPPEGPPAPPATGGGEPPEGPGRLEGATTREYEADDFLRTKLGQTGLDRETERIFRAEFERATAETGTFRRRVSDEEVQAVAHEIGQDPAAVQRVLSEQGLNAAEQLALLSIARSNTEGMADALSRLAQGTSESGGPLGEAERLELERQVERRAHLNNTLLSKWAEEGSEAGRTLRARQLEAFSIEDPIAVLGLAKRLKARSGGRPEDLTVDEQSQIVAALETGNKEQLAEYLTALDKQSPISKFFAVIKAMMLSLIQTHNVNLSSNAIKHVMGPSERFYASLADRAIAARRQEITGESFGRTTQIGRGELEGPKAFRESVPRAGRAWWYAVSGNVPKGQGEDIIEALRRATSHRTDVRRRIELTDPTKGISDQEGAIAKGVYAGGWAVETFTNGVLGALGAGDVLFRHPAYIRSLWEQAGIHARRAGLEKGTPEFSEMVHKLVEDPTGAMERQAELDSNESVFMDPTGFFDGVDDIIQKIKRGETMMGRPGQVIAESLAPFTRTLLGIADQTTDLTGLGILRGTFNASKLLRMLEENAARPDKQMGLGQDPQNALDPNNPEDAEFIARIDAAQKRASKQLGRGMLGATAFTLIAMLGSWLALRDRIKTRYPRDRREMELWRAQDIRPNSILINGKWRQTDFLGPYGLALMIGAYAVDIMSAAEDQRDEVLSESVRLATSLAESMMHVIGAVTIAQGLETVSELTAGEEGSFEEYARSIVRMPFPNILRGVARAIDPVRREADWQDPIDQYGASTPWMSETYPPRVDMLGRDIVGPEGVWANIFSPSRGAREDRRLTDPLLRELDRLGTAPIRPRRSDAEGWAAAAGIEITPDQWYRIQKRYGEAMADITRRTIALPSYQRADDDAKRATLERLWTSAKTRLNRELKQDISKRARQTSPRLQGPRPAVGAP